MDRISHSRAHTGQHLWSLSSQGEHPGPSVQWLSELPWVCNETGLSELVGLDVRLVFFLYQG